MEVKDEPNAEGVNAKRSGPTAEFPKSHSAEPLEIVLEVQLQSSMVTSRFVSNKWPGSETYEALSLIVIAPLANTGVPTTVPFWPPTESVASPLLKLYRLASTGTWAAATVTLLLPVTPLNVALIVVVPAPIAVITP